MAWLVLILLGSIWGASYLFIKVGGTEIPPFTFVAARTTLAGLALLLIFLVRRERMPTWDSRFVRGLWTMGLLNSAIPYTLITWGEIYISSGLAAILVGMMPIFTVLLAHRLTRDEKLTPIKMVGILVGFSGVVLLFLPDLLQGLQLSLVGGLAVVVATISYALAVVIARRDLYGIPHLNLTFGQMMTASAILVPLSLIIDRPLSLHPSFVALASVSTLAILGTALAYLMYYWLIEQIGATRTALVTYISPLVAVILGAILLGERLDWTTLAGLALIIAGVGLVSRKQREVGAGSELACSDV